MKRPLIQRRWNRTHRTNERGVTLALVAAAIVAILAMAALSIDVGSLYLANAEAQRAADIGALAGARSLSLAGTTGDPTNSAGRWAAACLQAEQVARATTAQNFVNGNTVPLGNIMSTAKDSAGDFCSSSSGAVAFGVNPQVTVTISGLSTPLFFAPAMRAFFSPGASRTVALGATATAEVYNPSAAVNFSASGLAVAPRCVKPWIIRNADPVAHPGNPAGSPFVNVADGSIQSPGIAAPFGSGVIGEQLILRSANCTSGAPCSPTAAHYVPALIASTANSYVAVPAGATTSNYQEASGGCDIHTVYACGLTGIAQADLTFNPGGSAGDTSVAVQSLINSPGSDSIDTTVYPFQIHTGDQNPLLVNGVPDGAIVSSSNSVVTVPIMDNVTINGPSPSVNIVGFLQVFVRSVTTANGHLNVTVLNVSGCGTPTGGAIGGTSPVPVRLVQ